jgi:hypothetical protein
MLFTLILLISISFVHSAKEDTLKSVVYFDINMGYHPTPHEQSFLETTESFGGNWNSLRVDPIDHYYWRNTPSFLSLNFELERGGLFFRGTLPFQKDIEAWYKSSHNVITGINEFDVNIPTRSFVGYSNDWAHLQFGRFKHKNGPSESRGVSLSTINPLDGLWSFADFGPFRAEVFYASLNPWMIQSEDPSQDELSRQSQNLAPNQRDRIYDTPVKTLMSHRLEWRHKLFILGLTEYALIGGKTPGLKEFSPFTAWHNNFGSGYTNSALSSDLVVNIKDSKLYGEISLDDINSGEAGGEGEGTRGTTMAWLLGASHAFETPIGHFFSRLEFISVDPSYGNHELPLLQATDRQVLTSNYRDRFKENYADIFIVNSPLSYWRGPDVIDLWLDLDWKYNSWFTNSQWGWLKKGRGQTHLYLDEAPQDSYPLSGNYTEDLLINFNFGYTFEWGLVSSIGFVSNTPINYSADLIFEPQFNLNYSYYL